MKKDKRTELDTELETAKNQERVGEFFVAAHHYKKALELARDLGDSVSITLCKNKVIETNKKSKSEFKEVSFEQQVSEEDIEKDVAPIVEGDLITVLRTIGVYPFLYPNYEQIKANTKMPVTFALASVSVISEDGHLVKGGTDGSHSWLMKTYAIHQGFINGIYLPRIFKRLITKGLSEQSLTEYLKSTGIFPEENLKIILIGINRYFARDYVSALHILVPQFENVFLFLSEKLKIDVVALNRGIEVSTQNKTLSAELLGKDAFQDVWGKNLCEQLKFILFDQLGYTLRHKVAHGYIKAEECNEEAANLALYLFLVLAARIGRKDTKEAK